MKLGLIRNVLLYVEANSSAPIQIDGYSSSEITSCVQKLIKCSFLSEEGDAITKNCLEFLDLARDDDLWNDTWGQVKHYPCSMVIAIQLLTDNKKKIEQRG